MSMILILLLNLLVGACIGLTGIAGFLLPMFYTGFLGMPAGESLALSFSAFLISGVLGSVTYYRQGNLDLKPAVILSAGSLPGALAGVWVNLLIPEDVMQMIIYIVVLVSGISILLRKDGKTDGPEKQMTVAGTKAVLFFLLGVATGAVCAASGAGGGRIPLERSGEYGNVPAAHTGPYRPRDWRGVREQKCGKDRSGDAQTHRGGGVHRHCAHQTHPLADRY